MKIICEPFRKDNVFCYGIGDFYKDCYRYRPYLQGTLIAYNVESGKAIILDNTFPLRYNSDIPNTSDILDWYVENTIIELVTILKWK